MSKSEEKGTKNKYKLIILGDSGVGKTSLISKFTTDSYDEETIATIGSSYSSKTLFLPNKDQTISLNIWDTAGQERYRSVTRVLFRDADAILFLYDITRKETFEALESYWLEEVEKEIGLETIAIGIAGNKADLYYKEQVDENNGKKLAEKYNSIFKLTSALDATGIEELFIMICERLCDLNSKKRTDTVSINPKKHSVKNKDTEKKCC